MEMLKKVGAMKCCEVPEEDSEKEKLTYCLNPNMIGREHMEIQERKKQNNKNNNYNQRGGHH